VAKSTVRRKSARSLIAWGPLLSGAGAYFFALTVAELLKPVFSPSYPIDVAANRLALQVAGALITAGWLLDRREQGLWPCSSPSVARLVRKAVSTIASGAVVIVGSLTVATLFLLLMWMCRAL
jgi:hypothetical protein